MESLIRRERLTGILEDEFVVFLIGVRLNSLFEIRKWLSVMRAMPRMIGELTRQPALGLLHAETWLGRTALMVQYWRSANQLLAYADSKTSAHLPAWKAFNKAVGLDGSIGIWHETYVVSPGAYESMYINMPAFGLGKAGALVLATGQRSAAADRLQVIKRQRPAAR